MSKMKFDPRIILGALMILTMGLWFAGITLEKYFWISAGLFLLYNIYSLAKKLKPLYSKK
ncbi:hypothetical protein FTO70_03100 [Methanosarcina sp. KYL-1]|uniref:hypothetical protein n=1 Tax=Methanosarcina sp. KYL-1 TaxID=2602068 RepID=UPI0021011BF4|nr:hypothetical protein [Methanosarcina sp. KYL-1]MCQ1534694.1 hypothetical protein [Methanosarcina sp. KYL-1]